MGGRSVRQGWKVSWREGGEQRSKTVYTFKHAKEVKAQIEAARAEGRRVDPIKGRIRYEDVIDQHGEEWMADLSAKARGNYEYTLRTLLLPFFGSKRLNQLGRQAIADWVSKVRPAWSPWTIKEAFVTLRSSLGYAVKSGRLDSNPVAGVATFFPSSRRGGRKSSSHRVRSCCWPTR